MRSTTYRQVYAKYRKIPKIRSLVISWYDGLPIELLEWKNRYILRRLVDRAERELKHYRDCGYSERDIDVMICTYYLRSLSSTELRSWLTPQG